MSSQTRIDNAEDIAECRLQLETLYRKEVDLIHFQRTLQASRARLITQIWSNCTNSDAAAFEAAGNSLRKITFAPMEHAIDAACDAYNAAHCRALIPRFYARLPRELRDMVYAYLTSGDVYVDRHVMPHATKPLKREPRGYFAQHPRSRGDLLCIEHFWRDEVVGTAVAQELMESWYRCSTFHVRDHEGARQEENRPLRFLEDDRFCAGIDPRQFVSCITVKAQLKCNRYGEPLRPSRVVEDLSYCVGKARRGTLIYILLEASRLMSYFDTALEEWLEKLTHVVVCLKQERLRVEVGLGGVIAGPVLLREDFLTVFKRWQKRVEKQAAAV